ncbi:MAG TPA: 1-(5-phosphoribosyl)-5-[(5-phosphoribosylamino)methylideneamino]imidazole-4-carboxamide isomerase [Actinomycetota bacterium]|nr:1-(5-phosphoribosyl)-5-[(5-phosphoribosylamino)methylideneamino]imidazole-4-carboxamide isomerase [Actinomycetota bacterium]
MIVLPAIDVRGGRVVRLTRGVAGSEVVYADHPVEVGLRFVAEGASWLHVVDLDAALGTGSNPEVLRELIAAVPVPVQLGGGIRSLEAVEEALILGAARVVLGTATVRDPGFLRSVSERFPDRVVTAIDTDGQDVLVRGWTEGAGALDELVPRLAEAGATRFLATAVDRDGTLGGPDLDLYRRLTALASVPIQASGGVRSLDDLRALAGTAVEGAVVGKALYEGTLRLADALGATT